MSIESPRPTSCRKASLKRRLMRFLWTAPPTRRPTEIPRCACASSLRRTARTKYRPSTRDPSRRTRLKWDPFRIRCARASPTAPSGRDPPAALLAAPLQDELPSLGPRPHQEPMGSLPLPVVGLKSSLHPAGSPLCRWAGSTTRRLPKHDSLGGQGRGCQRSRSATSSSCEVLVCAPGAVIRLGLSRSHPPKPSMSHPLFHNC